MALNENCLAPANQFTGFIPGAPLGAGSYLCNGKFLDAQLGAGNTVSTWYTQGMGEYGDIIAARDTVAGASSLQLYDASGNVNQTTDAGANITAALSYDAFGSITDNSGPANPTVAWQGKRGYQFEQPLGLQYVRQRWYDPVTRQFISQDPLGFPDATVPWGIESGQVSGGDVNLFRYAGNNPVNRNEPSGADVIHNGMDLGSKKLIPQIGTEAGDRATLRAELKSWQKNSYTFAAALLKGFLANKHGVMHGNATNAFNTIQWQNEPKNSKDYRSQAQEYLSNYAEKYVSEHSSEFPVGTAKDIPAPSKKDDLYIRFYFDIGSGDSSKVADDLMYALGGQTFTFTGKIHVSVHNNVLIWQTKGLHVSTNDNYDFPVYTKGVSGVINYSRTFAKELAALSQPAFRAGYDLEHHFGYKPSPHTESWIDQFSGTTKEISAEGTYSEHMLYFGHP